MAKKARGGAEPAAESDAMDVTTRAAKLAALAEAEQAATEWKPVRALQRSVAPLLEEARLALKGLRQFDRDHRGALTAAVAFLRLPQIQVLHFGAGGGFARRRDAAIAEWSGLLDMFEHNPIRLTRMIDDVEQCDPEALKKRPYLEAVVRRDLPEQIATVQSLERHVNWREGYQALLDDIESGQARPREGSWSLPPVPERSAPFRVISDFDAFGDDRR